MDKTGTLAIQNDESRLDGTLLGRTVASGQDPYGAATDFLIDNDCHDGDCVTVGGSQRGKVFYIDSAQKVGADQCRPGAGANLRMAERVSGTRAMAASKSSSGIKPGVPAPSIVNQITPARSATKSAKKVVGNKPAVKPAPKPPSPAKKVAKKAAKKNVRGR